MKPLQFLARPCPELWRCFLLPVDAFPIPRSARPQILAFVERFVSILATANSLSLEFFLQFNQLHHEDGPVILSEGGKDWLPQLGFGVWPDRDPPKMWTPEEFSELAPGEMMRPLMFQLFRVSTGSEARAKARERFFGTGVGLQVLVAKGDTQLLERTTALLQPRITEPSFRSFDYYFPLLDTASVAKATAEDLDRWLAGASVYIRESPEDSGLLFLSALPLTDILKSMKAVAAPDRSRWDLPISYAS